MAVDDGANACYLVAIFIALIFLIWGFLDMFRSRQPNEKSENQVISRQLRGIGLIVLSQVVLVIMSAICFSMDTRTIGNFFAH